MSLYRNQNFIVEIPLMLSYIEAFLSASKIERILIFRLKGAEYIHTTIADKITGTIAIGNRFIPSLKRKNPPTTNIKESIIIPNVVEEIAFFTVSASLILDKISPVFLEEKKFNGKCKR